MSEQQDMPATVPAPRNAVELLVEKYRPRIEAVLNQMVAYPAFLTAVLEDCAHNPKLRDAAREAPDTMVATLLQAAQMKLLPGARYRRYFLIPRRNKGRMEVTGMVSYQGLAEVAQRHDRVHSVEAFCVYGGEVFEFDPLGGKLTHQVNLFADRSDENLVGAYMVARIVEKATHNVNPVPIVWAMSRDEIVKRRGSSDAWRYAEQSGKKDSPWHQWFPDMCRKTVIRAGITKGAVPQEMWLAGALDEEDHRDLPASEPEAPEAKASDALRGALGLPECEREPGDDDDRDRDETT